MSTVPANEDTKLVNVLVYLNKWPKNAYGELVIYDKAQHDIAASVHPRLARTVAWDATLPFFVRKNPYI